MANMKGSGVEWIGEIPEEWSTPKFGFHVRFHSGLALDASELDEKSEYPVYGGGDAKGRYGQSNIGPNAVIVSRQGATCGTVRYIEGKAWATEHALIAETDDRVNPSWLSYALSSSNLGQYSMTAAQPGISASLIQSLRIAMPPVSEQIEIAALLDEKCAAIDATANTLETQISTLERYRASVIHEAVTRGLDPTAPTKPSGVDWIGNIPQGWKLKPFKHVASVVANLVKPSNYPDLIEIDPENIESGTGRLTDVRTAEEVGAISAKQLFSKGQIIYSKIRPALNKVVIAPEDGLCSADMYPIATQHNVRWLLYVMRSDIFVSQTALISSRVAMPKINVDQLGALKIPVPLIDEQALIADYLDARTAAIDAVIATKRKQLDVLKRRRQSLIYEYVTGKRRVEQKG